RKGLVALPDNDVVNPGEDTKILFAHLTLKIGTAEYREDPWIFLLNLSRQGQCCAILRKHRSESHDIVFFPCDRHETVLDEPWRLVLTQLSQQDALSVSKTERGGKHSAARH